MLQGDEGKYISNVVSAFLQQTHHWLYMMAWMRNGVSRGTQGKKSGNKIMEVKEGREGRRGCAVATVTCTAHTGCLQC